MLVKELLSLKASSILSYNLLNSPDKEEFLAGRPRIIAITNKMFMIIP